MLYYILPSNAPNASRHDYRIMEVKPAEEAGFLAAYGHQVIAKGSSLTEALLQFQQWKNRP